MEKKSAKELMAEGVWYDAGGDEELAELRERSQDMAYEFNQARPSDLPRQRELLEDLLGSVGEDVEMWAPLQVDYGFNVHIGAHTFVNHGAYFMDGAKITIGEHCFIGPDFGAYTAQHPLVAEERNSFIERALPIEVGNNVWIGARVTLLPGVHIGEGSVIAAGAVVTKDIPAHVLAAGVPARVVCPITDEDRIKK